MKDKAGMFSIEQICHFRCGNCDKWWSIGDPPEQTNVLKKKIWFCPWCGLKQYFNKKDCSADVKS